jgi:hypothetical protein
MILPSWVQAADCLVLSNDMRLRSVDAKTAGSVTLLQNFLIKKGQLKAGATGYFGQLTLGAVVSFQKEQGLPPTGFVGPMTRTRIAALTCAAPAPVGTGNAVPSATSTVAIPPIINPPNSGGVSFGGGGATISHADPKTAYLNMKAEYDAASTMDAFVAVFEKYASASRRSDVIAQKAFLAELSSAERNSILRDTIKAFVPSISEVGAINVAESGQVANILVAPMISSGKTATGHIVLVYEGGAWKLQSEKWQDPQGNGIEPLPSAEGG